VYIFCLSASLFFPFYRFVLNIVLQFAYYLGTCIPTVVCHLVVVVGFTDDPGDF